MTHLIANDFRSRERFSPLYEEMVLELVELRGVNKGLLAAAEGRKISGTRDVLRQALNDVKQESKEKRKKRVAG